MENQSMAKNELTPQQLLKKCVLEYSLIPVEGMDDAYNFPTILTISGIIICIDSHSGNVNIAEYLIGNKKHDYIGCCGWLKCDTWTKAKKMLDELQNDLHKFEMEYKQSIQNERLDNIKHDF